jgi:hypothetical protein
MGAFLFGTLVLTFVGFLIMAISKSKAKPWIILDNEEQEVNDVSTEDQTSVSNASVMPGNKSKFF